MDEPPENETGADPEPELTDRRWLDDDGAWDISDDAAGAAPEIEPQPRPAPDATPDAGPDDATDQPPNLSSAEQSRALAEAVIESFAKRLTDAARKRGGFLTLADLDELNSEFRAKTAQLQRVFQQTFEQYVKARERAAFDHARRFPFDRVIVNTFAHLFTPEVAAEHGRDRVSRRLLPGFFLAMDKMLGTEQVEGFQDGCRAIVERLAPGAESDLNWDRVYGDPETATLALDALFAFAPYFEEYNKRRDWFIALVNANLTPAEGTAAATGDHPEADWLMTERGFGNLVDGLFLDLRRGLADGGARDALAARHGGAACFAVEASLDRMDTARITGE